MEETTLRENLECPVCTLVPYKTKIFACLFGHQICQKCYDKLRNYPKLCPQGRCSYSAPPTQFRVLETMISKADIKLNCPNSGDGCLMEMKRKLSEDHVQECRFRKVPCPEADGQEKINLYPLEKHFSDNQDSHDDNEYVEPMRGSISFNLSDSCMELLKDPMYKADWKTRIGIQDGFRFWRVLVQRSNYWHSWIVMEASPKIADNWLFSIKIQNRDFGYFIEASGPVVCVDRTVEEILSSGSFLTMTSATVRKLVVKASNELVDWKLKLDYTVKKKKDNLIL